MENAGFKEAFDLRLDLLRPIDIKFLHSCERPSICVLYEDTKRARHVKCYQIESRDRELIPMTQWTQQSIEHGAKFIIPVSSPMLGGVIVIGETTITYLNGNKIVQSVAIDYTQICAHGVLDSDGSRYLLGDSNGNLYVLLLSIENGSVSCIAVDNLGVTNIAQSINYLDNGVVFIGSCYGDSQLIRLASAADEHGSYVQLLESYANIGPIVDMSVFSGERQGQSHLVTCSGGFGNGALSVVRSGIGIQEQVM